jgi:hypothetical protein
MVALPDVLRLIAKLLNVSGPSLHENPGAVYVATDPGAHGAAQAEETNEEPIRSDPTPIAPVSSLSVLLFI